LLKLNDIPVDREERQKNSFPLKICQRCSFSNPPANKLYSRCGVVIDEKTASSIIRENVNRKKADEVMDRFIQDQGFRAMLERKLQEVAAVNS
jgi:ribosomal protein L40E